MIEIRDLRKSFGEVTAVDGVSFEVGDGHVTGLLGPNGAGKTTTLRILYGLIQPDAGTASIDGIDIVSDPLGAQRRIGVLPDTLGLYSRLTAREHIRYFGRLHDMDDDALEASSQALIDLLDMHAIADRRTEGFSHGERMKVCLARALVHRPSNILLDEPTNGLDVMSTRTVREMINTLKHENKAVLFSSHVMHEVSTLCDRIVVISNGAVVAQGTPDEIRRRTGKDDLEEAFVALTERRSR
jgi:sodium transport system ATP-binding protein